MAPFDDVRARKVEDEEESFLDWDGEATLFDGEDEDEDDELDEERDELADDDEEDEDELEDEEVDELDFG